MKYLMLLLLTSCAHYPDGFKSDADYIHYLESSNKYLESKNSSLKANLEKQHQELFKEKEKVSKIKEVIKTDLKNIVSESMDKKETQ